MILKINIILRSPFNVLHSVLIGNMHDDITYNRPRLHMVSLNQHYHRKCIVFYDLQLHFWLVHLQYSGCRYFIIGVGSLQNFQRGGSKFENIRSVVVEKGSVEISSVSELTATSSQNSLIGNQAASSSQNSMTGGCGSGESILTTGGTEGIPRSDLTSGGELQVLTWCSQLPLVYWMEIV